MYEKTFGLKKRPFSGRASGAEVFVGPQTANTVANLKKALAAPDAAVAVTGPAGVGKTTLVHRALDTIDRDSTRIRIGRMQLRHDEVLEFLLEELGAGELPASTIRRIARFRALLEERRASGHRVCIVVEDAQRIGEDALAELEALTASDNGDSDGANLILMAAASLRDHLRAESLQRLNQRVRVHHRIEPFSEAELRAYLKHCLRMAGADFDLLFADDAIAAIHGCSEGVARSANTLVDAVLVAAAERNQNRIDAALIADVAGNDFELTVETRIPSIAADASTQDDDAAAAEAAVEPRDPAAESAQPEPAEAAQAAAPAQKRASEADLEVEAGVYDSSLTAPQEAEATQAEPTAAEPVAEVPEPVAEVPEPVAEVSEPVVTKPAPISEDPEPAATEPASEPPGAASIDDQLEHGLEAPDAAAEQLDSDRDLPESQPVPEQPEPVESEPATVAAAPSQAAATLSDEPELPDLIQDTQPELAVLNPANMPADTATEHDDDSESIPTLFSSARMEAPIAEPTTLSEDADGAKLIIGDESEPAPEPAPVSDAPAAAEAAEEASPAADAPAVVQEQAIDPVAAHPEAHDDEPEAPVPLTLEDATAEAPVPEDAVNEPPAPALELSLQEDVEPSAATSDAPADKPAWDRDPTLAELRPDLEALESAMAEFSEADLETEPEPEPAPEPVAEPELSLAESGEFGVPEITLDKAIQEKIDEAQAALEKHDATIAEGDAEALGAPAAADSNAEADSEEEVPERFADTQELKQFAGKLAQGTSLDEMDDRMAETLFGVELGNISDEILADQAIAKSANEPQAAPTAQPAAQANGGPAGAGKPAAAMDMSASQRLATVRALNAASGTAQPAAPQPPAAPVEKPAPIEDQMKSMTQNVEAPNFDIPDDDDDDDETGRKKGFFSRFRKS